MYLACADKEIDKKEKEVKECNGRLIELHNALPFWRRLLEANALRQVITENWLHFEKWVTQRIKERKYENG